jgi:hypothetical protein
LFAHVLFKVIPEPAVNPGPLNVAVKAVWPLLFVRLGFSWSDVVSVVLSIPDAGCSVKVLFEPDDGPLMLTGILWGLLVQGPEQVTTTNPELLSPAWRAPDDTDAVMDAVVDEAGVSETAALLSLEEYTTLIGIGKAPGPASETVKDWESVFGKLKDKLPGEITSVPLTFSVAVPRAVVSPPVDVIVYWALYVPGVIPVELKLTVRGVDPPAATDPEDGEMLNPAGPLMEAVKPDAPPEFDKVTCCVSVVGELVVALPETDGVTLKFGGGGPSTESVTLTVPPGETKTWPE